MVVPSVSADSGFAVLPFCRFGITLILLCFPLSVLPFLPTHGFSNYVFRFAGRAKVLKHAFDIIDADKSGMLDKEEFIYIICLCIYIYIHLHMYDYYLSLSSLLSLIMIIIIIIYIYIYIHTHS